MSEERRKQGDPVGDYLLAEPSGWGTAREVWRATHRDASERVSAIGFLPTDGEAPPPLAKPEMLRELDHPNILRETERQPAGAVPHVRLEWVDAVSLRVKIIERGGLDPVFVRDVADKILRALAYAHEKGVPHGSLRTTDVLVTRDGGVKVCDFGSAPPRAALEDATRLLQGAVDRRVHAAAFCAPEVAQGGIPDAQADLFSVGVLVWEMLKGRPMPDLTHATRLNPGLPPPWNAFVAHLLSDRNERYASAREALAALEKLPVSRGRARMPAWMAGPLFIVGVFLITYVGIGMPYLAPPIRLLALIPAGGLLWVARKDIRYPLPTALFWGGLFFGYAMRGLHVLALIGGLAVALAGAFWYYRQDKSAREEIYS